MDYNKETTTIDLGNALDISDLAVKISSVLESSSASDKEIYLNLGSLELKQSQLMSIKALIETMDSKLIGIKTTSELTLASAESLDLVADDYSNSVEAINESNKNTGIHEADEELQSFDQLKKVNSIDDFMTESQFSTNVNTDAEISEEQQAPVMSDNAADSNPVESSFEQNSQPEEIQSALDAAFGIKSESDDTPHDDNFGVFEPSVYKNEDFEMTETIENNNDQYVLLDTDGITPEGLELMRMNTSDLPTLYLTQTLRSGQTISYEGNIFIIGDAHPGSEVIATGDITIWGILGGIVHAGSKGNTDAKVRALKLNPIQLRIANIYSRRNDTINVPYVQKSNEFTPEEARIEGKRIVIYKTLRRED